MMVGRSLAERYPKAATTLGDVVLDVKNLCRHRILHDISFQVRKGEIVGIAGLVGSGRTSLARALFGADPADSGEIILDGVKVNITSPQDAINNGVALLTEDRRGQGLILELAVRDNILLPPVHSSQTRRQYLHRLGTVDYRRATDMASRFVQSLAIKAPSVMHQARSLSGGNQQKVVVAKWLATQAKIFIFDEPTRGIDVGAKAEIYRLMGRLAADGAGIIMISSEVEEILAISDRILIMRGGRIVAVLTREVASKELILRYAATEVGQ
jgi:ABC-type sugar transport system ATPase subunit